MSYICEIANLNCLLQNSIVPLQLYGDKIVLHHAPPETRTNPYNQKVNVQIGSPAKRPILRTVQA